MSEAEIRERQIEWMDAWKRRDRAALEAIVAAEFTLTSARTDKLVPKEGFLQPVDATPPP
jgi:hypothetical protein